MGTIAKKWKILLSLLTLLVVLLGMELYFMANCLIMDGHIYPRSAEVLDLRGQTITELSQLTHFPGLKKLDLRESSVTRPQLEQLQKELPACEILWELEFQGQTCPPDAKTIRVPLLQEKDLLSLQRFPELQQITVERVEDFSALARLIREREDCRVEYSVELSGENWPMDARRLRIVDPDPDQLRQRLPYLPKAESVILTGSLPELEQLQGLLQEFPWIDIRWKVPLGGLEADGQTEILTLADSGITDPEEILAQLPYFPNLQTVDLLDTDLTNAQKHDLVKACPGLQFRWDVIIGDQHLPGDTEEALIEGQTFHSSRELREAIPCFTRLQKLVILDSGLSNEELEDLNQAFPQVRVVWNMNLGGYELRTDDLYYMPNKYSGIEVSDEILEPLKYCTDMLCVDVGHRSVTTCQWAESMPKLKYLILADTQMKDLEPLRNLENLIYLEIFLTPILDYSPLLSVKSLEDLNLCYTYGDPEPIEQMTWLKRLWWSQSRAPASRLRECLPDTQVECNSGSSTGLGWREGQHYYDMRDLIGMGYLVG